MRFYLHQQMNIFLVILIATGIRVGIKTPSLTTHHHGGIIRIGGKDIVTTELVGIGNHLEQRLILLFTVNRPAGIKYFMSTMLRVSLSKHH